MIVRPKTETPKLGRKNIDAKTQEDAFAIYRTRFAPLADDIELIVEEHNGDKSRPDAGGVVESDGDTGKADPE